MENDYIIDFVMKQIDNTIGLMLCLFALMFVLLIILAIFLDAQYRKQKEFNEEILGKIRKLRQEIRKQKGLPPLPVEPRKVTQS